MADRPGGINLSEVVARELARLSVQNMELQKFMSEAIMSEAETAAFKNSLQSRQAWLYVRVDAGKAGVFVGKVAE